MASSTLISRKQPGGVYVMQDGSATTGSVFFVHSGTGTNSAGAGQNPDNPLASIDYAVGLCTANKGDRIYVMPGHTETVATAGGLTCDVAGVSIIGIPNGGAKPKVSFTATASTLVVSAAGVLFENMLFETAIDAVVSPILVQAADVQFLNIETREGTAMQSVDFITTTAAANRLLIDGWTHRGSASAGADTAISIVGGDGITLRNFWVDGDFAVACIENVTTAATNLTIGGGWNFNYLRTRNSADVVITLVATTTGNVGPNIAVRLQDNAANVTECVVGADMQIFQPILVVNLDGESSMNINITATTDA